MPPALHPLIADAHKAFQTGDLKTCVQFCDRRLSGAPGDVTALDLKAAAMQRQGDVDGAEAAYRAAIAIEPESDLHNDLTALLHASGQTRAAETAAREALLARPDDAQAHLQFAVILGEKDDLPAAEYHNRRALALAGAHPQILTNLALCLYNQGRVDEAEPLLVQAQRASPDTAMIMAHLSRVYEAQRDMAKAQLWLEKAEAIGRRTGEDFSLLRATYLANQDQPQAALDLIEKGGVKIAAQALLDKGRLLDRLDRPEEAWPAFIDAKAQLAQEMNATYDAGAVTRQMNDLESFFSKSRMAALPSATTRTDGAMPLFILGFPRSGTTLIEQMLSSHPEISAGGELPFVSEWPALATDLLPSSRPFPERLAQMQMRDFQHIPDLLRDYYLGRAYLYGVSGNGRLFTDKMPLNDVFLPLIRLAFPSAPIVRMVRHPLDVAISMLSHTLTHGYNCGFGIDTIIAHMQAMHRLNTHYDAVLEKPPLIVRYEDFVADQDGQTRRLLNYINIDFNDACLRFHENRRHAPTPSYAQVAKPLNDRSIGRWRKYARQLEPYMAAITPVIDAWGYSGVDP